MAAQKNDESMVALSGSAKSVFLSDCEQKHKELGKYQREYKKILLKRFKTRTDSILEKSYALAIERLQQERNELKAQIFVATSQPHAKEDRRYLQQIKCHVKCQENLSEEIQRLKHDVRHLEHQKGINDKVIYELNRKTVPDAQCQLHVEQARKTKTILENRLEVGMNLESKFTVANAKLRNEMTILLATRHSFNSAYTAMVKKLFTEKKYVGDLLDYARNVFEESIETSEKITNTKRKCNKENEQAKMAVQTVMRNHTALALISEFMTTKNQVRTLADLQPSEVSRRERFKRQHDRKIALYEKVLKELFAYTNTVNVLEVVERFQQQESLYYSYFSYANETSFHVTLLETAVERLYAKLVQAKSRNHEERLKTEEELAQLEIKLEERKESNAALQAQNETEQTQLQELIDGIAKIFKLCGADDRPLHELLGDQSCVNLSNLHRHLMLVEQSLSDIVHHVYVRERMDPKNMPERFTVKDLDKRIDEPTSLNEIVLTQQCPECAEGELINIDGDGGIADVASFQETLKKLSEAVNQPDMQYRLHSISQCRLPRSRLLAANRHI